VSYQFVQLLRSGPVSTLVMNRPEVLNAIHTPMHHEMQHALDDFAADDSQRVCIITGAGERSFCVGTDLKHASRMLSEGRRDELKYPTGGYAGLTERFDLVKPLIAAVNGFALGGGFEIALSCDVIVAGESATFALPEPLVGAVALAGGVHRLGRQIGLKNAMGMVLTGRRVSAAEGRSMGFVNEVVPAGAVDHAARAWADSMLRGSPTAIAASKQAMLKGLEEPSLADAIRGQREYPAFVAWLESGDALEGSSAFAAKRKPRWQVSE
jgi:enoyl-CoA hydratase/carnithine racemase